VANNRIERYFGALLAPRFIGKPFLRAGSNPALSATNYLIVLRLLF
jgi:hypothetical protein